MRVSTLVNHALQPFRTLPTGSQQLPHSARQKARRGTPLLRTRHHPVRSGNTETRIDLTRPALSYGHLALIAGIVTVAAGIGRTVAPALFLLATRVWALISVLLLVVTLVVLNVIENRVPPRTLRRHGNAE